MLIDDIYTTGTTIDNCAEMKRMDKKYFLAIASVVKEKILYRKTVKQVEEEFCVDWVCC